VERLAARTGTFHDAAGVEAGPVPFGLPALWLVVVVGAREAALRWSPGASHNVIAAISGFLCLVTAVNLDPIAWKVRVWWLWYRRN
jgi:uncharacterized membrane protein